MTATKLMTDMYGNKRIGGQLVAQPMDVEDMYAADLAAGPARLVAGSVRSPSRTVTWGIKKFEEYAAAGQTHRIKVTISALFHPRWLIVATRGFTIRLVLSHTRILLDDIDGDLFMGAAWDRAAQNRDLERFRIPCDALDPGHELHMDVTPRPRLLTIKGQKILFSAMVIGSEAAGGH